MKKIKKFNVINNNVGLFYIYVFVPAGSLYEAKNFQGGSHMLEHMLFRNKGHGDVSKILTSIGARYNAATSKDVTYYHIKSHTTHFKEAMEIMGQLVMRDNFTNKDLDSERKVVIEEYNQLGLARAKSEIIDTHVLMTSDNVYHAPVIGTLKTLKSITLADLKKYYQERYKEFMILVNCEKNIERAVMSELSRIYGPPAEYTWEDESLREKALILQPKIFILHSSISQNILCVTFRAFPAEKARKQIILDFIEYCLTSSGIYSILHQDLRVNRGLVYSIHSHSESYKYIGFFHIQLGTSCKQPEYILSLIMSVLSKMKSRGLPDAVLNFYKKSYHSVCRFRYRNEDVRTEREGLTLFYNAYIDEKQTLNIIKNITNEDIVQVCREIFDFDVMGVFSMGRYHGVEKTNKNLEDVIRTYAA